MGMSGEVVNVDPSLAYIAWFANVVELYQKKNHNCFRCVIPDHPVKDYPKKLGKIARKVGLNLKEGMARREASPLRSWQLHKRPPRAMLPKHKNV